MYRRGAYPLRPTASRKVRKLMAVPGNEIFRSVGPEKFCDFRFLAGGTRIGTRRYVVEDKPLISSLPSRLGFDRRQHTDSALLVAHWSTRKPTRFPWRESYLIGWNSKAGWSRWTPYTPGRNRTCPGLGTWGRLSANGQGE